MFIYLSNQALLKHKETIDKRYIEVYKSSRNEMAEQLRKMKLLHSKRCPPMPQVRLFRTIYIKSF